MFLIDVAMVARQPCREATGTDTIDVRGRDWTAAAVLVLLKRAFPDCDRAALREAVLTRLEGGRSN